ncbi:ISL3 family transposase [Streptomyces sp. APSN-46.1]|uniref:ISL3 family transposase n=1 Tax=Streptomyces sp. APSN-46.1 TaxID=2929049 RepID=UPI001FB2195B|nr:ISL3 family transposase [Streptomyces sp. APSN-46.1]MCJ1676143.1 ISL3 family transposase [Streptomyces sp. APSN-46.1]
MCVVAVEELLPQLAGLRIERVETSPEALRITAVTRDDISRACSGCGQMSQWTHSRYVRRVADEAVGGHPLVIDLSVRRLYCENPDCPKVTFVEQVDGLTERYQRRTPALRRVVEAVAVALAGSAGARLLTVLHHVLSGATVLNCLMRIALPDRPVPPVAGIDEFALLKGHRYATIIIDADTGERIEVLPDRRAATITTWLREHPGVHTVCRDGSGGFAQATRAADPTIVQVMDRWHLWHGLAEAAWKEVTAHGSCWGKFGPPLREGKRAASTRERWRQIHELLDAGVSLLECARRLGLTLNTVKRYARHSEPDRLVRTPTYRPGLVDPYRDHLRKRRLAGACPETTALAGHLRSFADLLTPDGGNAEALTGWIAQAHAADLPFLHSFANGLERDRAAVDAAVTLPHHNGRTEGVNNKIKLALTPNSGR